MRTGFKLFKPHTQNPGAMPGQTTPANKLVQTAKLFGNENAQFSQGTTFQIYDSILLAGDTELNFFENSGSKGFPLTNVNQQNGKLGVAETMVIMQAQLLFITFTAPAPSLGPVVAISDLSSNLQFQQSELSFIQGNSRVLKRMKLQTWSDQYNKNSRIPGYNVFHFDTFITIQSLLEFTAEIRLPAGVTVANTYAQLIFEGVGGIFASKTNY